MTLRPLLFDHDAGPPPYNFFSSLFLAPIFFPIGPLTFPTAQGTPLFFSSPQTSPVYPLVPPKGRLHPPCLLFFNHALPNKLGFAVVSPQGPPFLLSATGPSPLNFFFRICRFELRTRSTRLPSATTHPIFFSSPPPPC